jgi:GNAT superfamily N-acetyltransferase
VRRAGPQDARALRRMLRALMAHSGNSSLQPIKVAQLAHYMSAPRPEVEAVIAEREGRAVGMALFFPWLSTWRGRFYLYIQDLYVEAAERGNGVGRQLLAAAAREGRTRSCHSVLLAAQTSNAEATRFYTRLGFRCLENERLWLMPPTALATLIRISRPSVASNRARRSRNHRGSRRLR